eukprot:4790021-Prymnesium_polylepis.1
MQLCCFARCQCTAPGSVPRGWVELAQECGAPIAYYRCKISGEILPPRARYLRRTGSAILGFDHYCHWLGTAVGLHNRKFFVLFVVYSAAFCIMGAAHSLHDLRHSLPAWLGVAPPPSLTPSPIVQLLEAAHSQQLGQYAALLGLSTLLNSLAA